MGLEIQGCDEPICEAKREAPSVDLPSSPVIAPGVHNCITIEVDANGKVMWWKPCAKTISKLCDDC